MSIAINGKVPSGFAINGKSVSGIASNGKVIFKKNNGNIDISTLENLIYNSNFRYNDYGYKDYSEDTNYNSIISNPEDGWLQVKAQRAGSTISFGCTLTEDLIPGHTYYARCRFDYNQPNGSYRARLRLKKTKIEVGQIIDSGLITEQPINLSGFFTVNDETYLNIDFVQGSDSQSTTIQRKIKEPTLIDVTDLINSGISKPNIKSALDNTFISDEVYRRRLIPRYDDLSTIKDNKLYFEIPSNYIPLAGESEFVGAKALQAENGLFYIESNQMAVPEGQLGTVVATCYSGSKATVSDPSEKFYSNSVTIMEKYGSDSPIANLPYINIKSTGSMLVNNWDLSHELYYHILIEDPNIRHIKVGDNLLNKKIYLVFPIDFKDFSNGSSPNSYFIQANKNDSMLVGLYVDDMSYVGNDLGYVSIDVNQNTGFVCFNGSEEGNSGGQFYYKMGEMGTSNYRNYSVMEIVPRSSSISEIIVTDVYDDCPAYQYIFIEK